MDGFPWIIIGLVVGLVLVGIILVVLYRRKKEKKFQEIDYRAFFILGVTFLPLGVLYEIIYFVADIMVFLVLGLAFIAMGITYLGVGLKNRDKWPINKPEIGGDG